MVNYEPWSLEQFGTTYVAAAITMGLGVDVGKASAGSDEVEHMFGVFLERYEDIAKEYAENYSSIDEWVPRLTRWHNSYTELVDADQETDGQIWTAYVRKWRQEEGCELTPNQARVLVQTIITRIQVEVLKRHKEISENFEE